jgi:hypothetical protein
MISVDRTEGTIIIASVYGFNLNQAEEVKWICPVHPLN